jgi:hypothetical protein
MPKNKLPPLNMKDNPTGCCPRFVPKDWEEKKFIFDKKRFIRANTINFTHIPLNMGSVITKTWKKITDVGADDKDEFAILSYDPSPWKGEHYFTVTKDVPGVDNVTLTGTYITKVFEGPYKDAKKWVEGMQDYVKSKKKRLKRLYFYYTTCPKCAKYYGKNYTVAFAQI